MAIALSIFVSIYCYLIKYRAKQKYLLGGVLYQQMYYKSE